VDGPFEFIHRTTGETMAKFADVPTMVIHVEMMLYEAQIVDARLAEAERLLREWKALGSCGPMQVAPMIVATDKFLEAK
jgi:hypothetical protein